MSVQVPTYFIMHVFSIINISCLLIFFTQWLYPGVLNTLINKFKRCMDQNSQIIQTQQKEKKKKKRNPSTPENKGIGAQSLSFATTIVPCEERVYP